MKTHVAILLLALLCPIAAQAATFHEVDLTGDVNARLQDPLIINGHTFPEGPVVLGGVPFDIPVGGDNYWGADHVAGSNPIVLEVAVGVFGVFEVHTLINTFWGQAGPPSLASVEFIGSDGAFHVKDLFGDEDIRDYNQNPSYTNAINGTTSVQVFDNGLDQRLDKQQIVLPATFLDETLETIRVVDVGQTNVQRVFVSGITVHAVPLPPSVALLVPALAMLGMRRRRAQSGD